MMNFHRGSCLACRQELGGGVLCEPVEDNGHCLIQGLVGKVTSPLIAIIGTIRLVIQFKFVSATSCRRKQ